MWVIDYALNVNQIAAFYENNFKKEIAKISIVFAIIGGLICFFQKVD